MWPLGRVGGVGGSRVYWGAGRECRYSGARRVYVAIRESWGYKGGVGSVRGLFRLCRGCQGCIGCGKWIESPTTLGPSPGSQHSHWFPLGSDLPHQGQARAPVEGPITPTGFPWEVTYLAKAKQVTGMSSAGYYIHLELYLVTVCTFVLMPPNHIFLHAM